MRAGWYSVVIATVVVGGIAATAANAAADGGTVAGGKTVDITGSCDGGGGGGGGGEQPPAPSGTEDTATPSEETLVDTHGGCWDKALNGGCGANGPEERESMEVPAHFLFFSSFSCFFLAAPCPFFFSSSSLVMVMAPHCHIDTHHTGHIPSPPQEHAQRTPTHGHGPGPHHSRARM